VDHEVDIYLFRARLFGLSEGGQLLPGSVTRHYRRGHLVLPGVLPGVTWSVTWCYLECYLVLPGVLFWSLFFLWSQNIRVSQTQTFGKELIFTQRCYLGPRL
jgi:hypothetical protein